MPSTATEKVPICGTELLGIIVIIRDRDKVRNCHVNKKQVIVVWSHKKHVSGHGG